MVHLSHPYITAGKAVTLTVQTFVGRVLSLLFFFFHLFLLSLLFNTQSRIVIAFLPRSKQLLISWLQSPFTVILELMKIKSVIVSPSICHEVMGP